MKKVILITKRIAGSSLIEVCVAMVLIGLISSIATLTFLNVLRSRTVKIEILSQVKQQVFLVKQSGRFHNEVIQLRAGSIVQTCSPSTHAGSLLVLRVAYQNLAGRELYVHRELVSPRLNH